jgi:hypothetical protein
MSEQRQKFDQEKELKRRSFQQDRQPSREVSRTPRVSLVTRSSVFDLHEATTGSDNEDDFSTPDASGELLLGQAMPRPTTNLGKQQRPTAPCHAYITTGKCDKPGCEYQHDKESAVNWLVKRAHSVLSSPFYPVNASSKDAHLKDIQAAMSSRKLFIISDEDQLKGDTSSLFLLLPADRRSRICRSRRSTPSDG